VDTEVGRLMRKLDELNLADNTIVVFSSDNGPEDIHIRNASHCGVGSAGPFRGRKRSLYEGGVRVPFIVRWPAGMPGGRIDDTSVIGGVDFLPTICSLAGVDVPADVKPDGQDMSAALRGRPMERTRPLMWDWRYRIYGHVMHHSPRLAIRSGQWKLLMNPDRSRVELYDIPGDPREMNNLAKEHPDVVERLAGELLAWQKSLPESPIQADAGSNDYPWPK
jgi:N-acetylgalactosamine-6-sulfatase